MFPDIRIEGMDVTLRKLEKMDLSTVVGWFNDPVVCKGLGRKPGLTLDEEEGWYGKIEKDPTKMVFAIENKKKVHVGNIALNRIDEEPNVAMVSLVINKPFWGKGYATAALNLLIQYGKKELSLKGMYATVYPFNKRSITFFEKCGFKHENRDEPHEFDGKMWKLEVLSISI